MAVPDTVADIQRLINVMRPASKLKVDGIVGPATASAYKALSGEQRASVEELAKARNPQALEQLRVDASAVKPVKGGQHFWIPESAVLSHIRNAIDKLGDIKLVGEPSDLEGHLLRTVRMEANQKTIGGVRHYDALSTNGSHRGLFQIHPRKAYADVKARYRDVPDWGVVAVDPMWNTYVAAAYSHILVGYLRNEGYSGGLTSDVLYAAHNQGAAGLMSRARKWAATAGKQSGEAKDVVATAAAYMATQLA